jgi:ribonuclease HI
MEYITNTTPPLENSLVVFTDGACLSNGRFNANASWAVVWPDHPECDQSGRVPTPPVATNNRGELMAIIKAFEIAKEKLDPTGEVPMTIYTDSMLMMNTVTTWLRRWKQNGWRKGNNDPAANTDMLIKLDALMEHRKKVKIYYVRAHTGKKDWASLNNDKADKMARDACMSPV